jgi:hypothetical protein
MKRTVDRCRASLKRRGRPILALTGGVALVWGTVSVLGYAFPSLFVDADYLTTLLQVVPATVVAVFVFAAGAVFVVAQVIHSPLGSRAVEDLMISKRVFAAVLAGVLLLCASLALVVLARPPDEPILVGGWIWPFTTLTVTKVTGRTAGLDFWAASAGTTLAVTTAIYAPVTIWGVIVVLLDFVRPDRYKTRLVPKNGKWRSPPHEDLYRRVRAVRQWLRISCGSGESRDLAFALLGMRDLVEAYTACLQSGHPDERPPPEADAMRSNYPAEYDEMKEIVGMHWLPGERGEAPRPSVLPGWFGDEFGRAVARSLETGILRSSLLQRDADRLLGLMCWAVERFGRSGRAGQEASILAQESGYVLNWIAEIGLFSRSVPDSHFSTWCFRASSRTLLRFAGGSAGDAEPGDRTSSAADQEYARSAARVLAGRALAGWILVTNEELRRAADADGTTWPPTRPADWRHLLRRAGLSAMVQTAYGSGGNGPSAHSLDPWPLPSSTTVARIVRELAGEVRWTEAAAPDTSIEELTHVVVQIAMTARCQATRNAGGWGWSSRSGPGESPSSP